MDEKTNDTMVTPLFRKKTSVFQDYSSSPFILDNNPDLILGSARGAGYDNSNPNSNKIIPVGEIPSNKSKNSHKSNQGFSHIKDKNHQNHHNDSSSDSDTDGSAENDKHNLTKRRQKAVSNQYKVNTDFSNKDEESSNASGSETNPSFSGALKNFRNLVGKKFGNPKFSPTKPTAVGVTTTTTSKQNNNKSGKKQNENSEFDF